jgi:hypothetical protein
MPIGVQVPGDLALTADGTELVLTTGSALAIQQIRTSAAIWQGTLAWDPDAGLPMFDVIVVKGPDFRVLRAVFRTFILSCAAVESVEELTVSLDKATRLLTVRFAATCSDGVQVRDTLAFALA